MNEMCDRCGPAVGAGYRVDRPRVESLFARIERWRDLGSGETRWRPVSSANITTPYGATSKSRIADPADPARVFSWLIRESDDDAGNAGGRRCPRGPGRGEVS